MKTGKFISRIIVLLLVFFLTTAGAAQALNISKCKGECCQNIQNKSHHKCSAHRLSAHPSIEFKSLLLLCDPTQQFRALALKTPEQRSCHNGIVPPCCEMAQANDKAEGLISTELSKADRPLEFGPADRLEKDINSQVTSWFAGSTSQHLTNKFAVVQLS